VLLIASATTIDNLGCGRAVVDDQEIFGVREARRPWTIHQGHGATGDAERRRFLP
jgi:hypothetical protein